MVELRFSWSSIFSSTPSSLTNTSIAAQRGGQMVKGVCEYMCKHLCIIREDKGQTSKSKQIPGVCPTGSFCFAFPSSFFQFVSLCFTVCQYPSAISSLSLLSISLCLSRLNNAKRLQSRKDLQPAASQCHQAALFVSSSFPRCFH